MIQQVRTRRLGSSDLGSPAHRRSGRRSRRHGPGHGQRSAGHPRLHLHGGRWRAVDPTSTTRRSTVEMTAPAAVAPGDDFSASFAVTIDMGTADVRADQALTGTVDLPLITVGGQTQPSRSSCRSATAPVATSTSPASGTGKLHGSGDRGRRRRSTVGDARRQPHRQRRTTPRRSTYRASRTPARTRRSARSTSARRRTRRSRSLSEPTVSGKAAVGKKLDGRRRHLRPGRRRPGLPVAARR